MRKTSILLSIITLLILSDISFSWDSTAAKYYPLAVGNVWSYHRINRTGPSCIIFTNEYNYLVTVVSDTLMPNGKRYFKIQGPAVTYERIDSTTMNVYKYSSGSECITDSLLAKLNNNFNSCRQFGNSNQFMVEDTSSINFASVFRRTLGILGNMLIGHHYILMYGMGLYRESACENGGAIITLNGCVINGVQTGVILGLNNIAGEIPGSFSLTQNYPNPFNPTTNIGFRIAEFGLVRIVVFDVLGRELQTLVDQELRPGTYEVDFDGSNLPSGVYYYKLECGSFVETKRMVLIK